MAHLAAERLREKIPEIMHRWEERVRAEVPAARDEGTAVLRDHLPEMLEVMARILADEVDTATAARDFGYIISHGSERAALLLYTLEQMILECQVLQEVVFIALEPEHLLGLRDRTIVVSYLGGVLRYAAGAYARVQTEETRTRDALYRAMIEDVHDYAIFLIARDGRIARWNAGAERITGFSEEEAVDQPVDILFTPEDRAAGAPQRELAEAAAHGRAGDNRWQQKKDGSQYWAEGVTTALRDAAGEAVAFCKVMRDGTRQKQLEEDLRDRVEALNHADQAKDTFLAMLGHELRNPLSAASNALYILQQSIGPAAAAAGPLGILERQVAQMGRLVNDLLDVARVTQGRIRIETRPVQVDRLVAAVVNSWQDRIARKGLEVHFHAEPGLVVAGDAFRLEQVVSNLISNAVRYTRAGEITVRARRTGKSAEIAIRDTGEGISADVLPHVFELFSQGEVPLARSEGGLGVGLTIVAQVVERHGGRVTAQSEGPGQGSVFTVTLPLWQDGPPEMGVPATSSDSGASEPLRVLVVDDNRDAADALVEILEMWGHTAAPAYDGYGALDAARRIRPHTALLDIGLPGLDGYAVAARLREDPMLARTRIIALTGYGQAEDQHRIQDAGFDGFLLKPVNLEALQALLHADSPPPAPDA